MISLDETGQGQQEQQLLLTVKRFALRQQKFVRALLRKRRSTPAPRL